jgi:hypothetical protein
MDTIKTYLENVFKSLPQSEKVLRIKNELLCDMEAKYEDFRAAGKSEHEATALTIGEFGNIDELLTELGIELGHSGSGSAEPEAPQRIVSRDDASAFLSISAKASRLIAAGVALILLGAALMHGIMAVAEFYGGNKDFTISLSVVSLLLFVIPAVGLFIYAGLRLEKYNYLESGEFTLEADTQQELEKELDDRRPKYIAGIIAGVGLILLSFVIAIVLSTFGESYIKLSVSLFLCMIAIPIVILIRTGMTDGACKKLLKTGDYSPKTRKANKVIGGVAAFVWPMVTCVFLIWGLVYDGWHIAWIVFPIAGMLFGGFAGLYSTLKGE